MHRFRGNKAQPATARLHQEPLWLHPQRARELTLTQWGPRQGAEAAEPSALPPSIMGPHLIADPCYCPIETSSQGSCLGRSPSLPSLSPEVFFLALFGLRPPLSQMSTVPAQQTKDPGVLPQSPGLTSRPHLTSEAMSWCRLQLRNSSLDWPGQVSATLTQRPAADPAGVGQGSPGQFPQPKTCPREAGGDELGM